MPDQPLGRAVYVYDADTRPLDRKTAEAKTTVDRAGASMQMSIDRRMASMSASMGKVGSTLTRRVTAPILGLGAATVKMSADFNAAMERVHTQSGASQKEVDNLRGKVLALAKVSSQGPVALAESLYRLEGAGFHGAAAMKALKAAADLAAVGNANVEETTKTLTQVLKPGIKGVSGFHDAVAQVNATVGAGDLRLQNLVDALGTGVVTSAKMAGLSFKDVTGAMAVFGDETNNVSGWAAQLATAFHFITNPTQKAQGALQSIGLQGDSLAKDFHKPQGLLTALTDLKSHLDALPGGLHGVQAGQVLGDIFPGGRGRVLTVLLNQTGLLEQKMKQISKTTGQFSGDVVKTQQTTAYKIHQAWSTIQADAVKLGDAFGPDLMKVGETVASDADKVASAFMKLSPQARQMIITGGLIGAAIGPAMKVAGVFLGGVAKLTEAAKLAAALASGKRGLFGAGTGGTGVGSVASRVATMEVGEMTVARMVGSGVAAPARASRSWPMSGTSTRPTGTAPTTTSSVAPVSPGEAAATEASIGSMFKSAMSRVAGGGMIAMSGVAASQIAGSVVGGQAGSTISREGSWASVGAGIGSMIAPGIGTAVGAAVAAGVGEGIHLLKGQDYGGKVADAIFSHGFGGAAAQSLQAQLRTALDEYHKLAGVKTPQWQNPTTGQWTGQQHLTASEMSTWKERFQITGLSPQQVAKKAAAAHKAGEIVAKQLEAGWNSYRFQSEPIMFSQFDSRIKSLPAGAQAAAADAAIKFAQSLEKNGRLSQGSTTRFINQIEGQFPALVQYMGIQAGAGARSFEKHLDLTASERKLNGQLRKIASDFPQVQHAMSSTAGDAQTKAAAMVTALASIDTHGSSKMAHQVTADLLQVANALRDTKGKTGESTAAMVHAYEQVVAKGTRPMRDQAESDLRAIRSKTASDMQATANSVITRTQTMQAQSASNFHHMQHDAASSTQQIASDTESAMGKFADAITSAMANGTLTTGQGMNLLITNLNRALKELGQKQLSQIQVAVLSRSASNSSLLKQGKTPAGGFRATGGLVQFGQAGAHGTDNILASIGGTDVMVGSGEQAMVLTRHQQDLLNTRLSDMGGLSGMFQKVNRPHYMAHGGQVPGTVRAPTVTGSGTIADLVKSAVSKAGGAANKYLSAHTPKSSPSGAGGPVPPGTVRDWLIRALRITGLLSPGNLSALYGRTMQESSGNPRAINLWDSNAQAGHPSKGLLQTIDGTFATYHLPGMNDIWNPIDNAVAAIRYMMATYGHIVGPSGSGYARGGFVPRFAKGGTVPRFTKGGSLSDVVWKGYDKGLNSIKQSPMAISQSMGTLKSLLGPAGDFNRIGERLSFYPSMWAISNPLLGAGASSFINTTDALGNSVMPTINTTGLGLTRQQEQQELGWYGGQITDIRQAVPIAQHLVPLIRKAIAQLRQRIAQIKAAARKRIEKIKAKIRANLKTIANLNARITKLQNQTEPHPYPKNAGQRNANTAWVKQRRHTIYGTDGNGGLHGQILALEAENKTLSGDELSPNGTGGKIGAINTAMTNQVNQVTKQITGLQNDLGQVTGSGQFSPLTLQGATGMGGQLGPLLVQQAGMSQQFGSISDPNIQQALAAAIASYNGTTSGSGAGVSSAVSAVSSPLDTISAQLTQQTATQNQVLSSQYGVLQSAFSSLAGSLPRWGGSFATGGVVPGVLGEPRTIIAHGSETVIPPGKDGTPIVNVHIERRSDLAQIIDHRIEIAGRGTSRKVGYRLPSRGGGGW